MTSRNTGYERIMNSDRVIHNYNPQPQPQRAKIFEIKNDGKPRARILSVIVLGSVIGAAAAVGGINLSKLASNLPPTPNEQIEDTNYQKIYLNALENYSREAHRSGQDKEFLNLELRAKEVPVMINGRYAAFSTASPNARYVDNSKQPNESVSSSDIINFVRAYVDFQRGE